ncbi:hypothetical protein HYDPIDRAFT_88260 [Hydnomerulius pinastri MD-312]|nr:hypothetical protein HYDPIDRAFT_88260 [Hydnomerulius pinastri MD-312]
MASSWRNLEHLNLSRPGGWRLPSRTTLPGLVPLLQACPFLGIVVDATHDHVPSPPRLSSDIVPNTALKAVDFSNSLISLLESVAAYLSVILPSLRRIACGDYAPPWQSDPSEHKSRWAKVERILNGVSGDWPRPYHLQLLWN